MTFSGALGGYAFKKMSLYQIGINKGFIRFFLTGGSLYAVGVICNVILLKHLPYTLLYPLSSITYIWTLILSFLFLAEKVTVKKIAGVLLILLGSLLII